MIELSSGSACAVFGCETYTHGALAVTFVFTDAGKGLFSVWVRFPSGMLRKAWNIQANEGSAREWVWSQVAHSPDILRLIAVDFALEIPPHLIRGNVT